MHLLVTGIPATGKTTFARWLVANHGYVRCPAGEEPGSNFYADIAAALNGSEDVVIDWGFPVQDLPKVKSLIAAGTVGWWFDGDRDAAFAVFSERKGHPGSIEDWHRQLAQIQGAWPAIAETFEGHILAVISSDRVFMSNEQRLQRICQ
ncbi:MAG: hypothetical protein M0Z92_14580 [Actinomycetota bacterium]|nr:hypothetical protein [Actinomycetota bacterium]